MKQIVVIGSINLDIVSRVKQHPLPGETIKSVKTEFNPGGKGANQAVAAARAGGNVTMAGAVGNDPFGEQLLTSLEKDKINIENVVRKTGKSGLAFITVNESGENSIILEEGANGQFTKENADAMLKKINGENTILLLQNEIPWMITEWIINKAHQQKIPVFLNPAPAKKISDQVLSMLNGLFVNETEAEVLSGVSIVNEQSARRSAQALLQTGVGEIIITAGKKGSYYADQAGTFIFTPAYLVTAIDTTAAGDTFIGTYIVAKASGKSTEASLQFATVASALTVMKEGAQLSIPNQALIQSALNQYNSKIISTQE